MSLGQWPPGLAREEFDAWELGQAGQAVGGGFPVSAEGWDEGWVVGERFQSRGEGLGGVTGAR